MSTIRLESVVIPPDVLAPREEDIERAVSVIENENLLIGGAIICAHAGHCAMGSLLFAAGMTNFELVWESGSPGEFSVKAQKLLYDTYRIGCEDALHIVSSNDSISDTQDVPMTADTFSVRDLHEELATHPDVVAGQTLPSALWLAYQPTAEEMENRKRDVIAKIRETMSRPGARSWQFMEPEEDDYEYDEIPY